MSPKDSKHPKRLSDEPQQLKPFQLLCLKFTIMIFPHQNLILLFLSALVPSTTTLNLETADSYCYCAKSSTSKTSGIFSNNVDIFIKGVQNMMMIAHFGKTNQIPSSAGQQLDFIADFNRETGFTSSPQPSGADNYLVLAAAVAGIPREGLSVCS